ncbi:MAG: methionyl-tRNA formyltransferase [Chloroflexi bacterium]|nr:methionyl-tRNA formyltransferase [Chloroflexota bacterium]
MARIAFLGTPEYAVQILQACMERHEVVYVVTQPDRHGGRGRRALLESPVKQIAREASIPVLQPPALSKDPEALGLLRAATCDVFVLAAYGQILRRAVLSLPARGVIGVHASLLPRWRGASPVAAAIRAGDRETGVTLMLTGPGLDTGPILAASRTTVREDDTTESLTQRLSELGARLLVDTLPRWLNCAIDPQPQDEVLATYAPEIRKEEGHISWSAPAAEIERHVRAMTPWPGAYTVTPDGLRIIIQRARTAVVSGLDGTPGTLARSGDGIFVLTGAGLLRLISVQPAGRRVMSAEAFVSGQRALVGQVLR